MTQTPSDPQTPVGEMRQLGQTGIETQFSRHVQTSIGGAIEM